MIQSYTILLDSLRMLRSNKIFWISLWISMAVALSYASIGFTDRGISVGFGLLSLDTPILRRQSPDAARFYLMLFTDVIIRFWLGWFSLILAIISTASIFPKFLQSGSIDLALSKPISRAKLFLCHYVGALSFVGCQTLLFCIIAFFAVGLRLDIWNLSVFWAVLLIPFSFSLVFCVSALLGVLTRSTLISLLGSLLFWVMTLVVQWSEDAMYKLAYVLPEVGLQVDFQGGGLRSAHEQGDGKWEKIYHQVKAFSDALPKTRECTLALKRLIRFDDASLQTGGLDLGSLFSNEKDPALQQAMARYEQRHSLGSIVIHSLLFELVVLGIAIVFFHRRDY